MMDGKGRVETVTSEAVLVCVTISMGVTSPAWLALTPAMHRSLPR